MGKDNKEKIILTPKEAAALLRELADRISGVEAEFEKDQPPSNGGFHKLKLSLKRAKDSNHFVVKCKVKSECISDSKDESITEREEHPQSMDEAATGVAPAANPAVEETHEN